MHELAFSWWKTAFPREISSSEHHAVVLEVNITAQYTVYPSPAH
jgi:hypothetical protein